MSIQPVFEVSVKVSMQDIIENTEPEADYDSNLGVNAYLQADFIEIALKEAVVARICNSFDAKILSSIRQLAQAEIKEKININAAKLVDEFFKEKRKAALSAKYQKVLKIRFKMSSETAIAASSVKLKDQLATA